MVTKEQAVFEDHFHSCIRGECNKTVGPRGGVKFHCDRVRRSGSTKTWVTRPNKFRVPVKFGMYESGYITDDNANMFHVASECPVEELRSY